MSVAELSGRRLGRQTVALARPPRVVAAATIAGRIEDEGPLRGTFDKVERDDLCGMGTWEAAEAAMLQGAVRLCLGKADRQPEDVDLLLAGDLLNQIVSSNFAARGLGLPYYGLFGACSVSTQGLSLGALLIDGGLYDCVVVATASHHLTAERQYRFPTELGVQRLPQQSWTATGAAAFLIAAGEGEGPRITTVTTGIVADLGIKDPNSMGAAMAPAAAGTIAAHFRESGLAPTDYDCIVTGDLGRAGLPLLHELLREDHGLDLGQRLHDAGVELYHTSQDVHSGGSGPACSALFYAANILPRLQSGEIRRALLVATGSLHSPTTFQQGESIPCVAHAVALEADPGC